MKTYSFIIALDETKKGHLGEVSGYTDKRDYEEDWESFVSIIMQGEQEVITIIERMSKELTYPDKFMTLLLCKAVVNVSNEIVQTLNEEKANGN